ncbi:MAG TPA: 3-keto-5-aminohexanoate cleavage protein [Frankiaceae bacterium]|nr:3-keto-5-aminohexanoate cleavage protein [Frankiaceae bacterium]
MTGTLITVAPTGAETAKAKAPALPVTLDELVAAAKGCEAAGAAVIHVHLRDADGGSSLDLGALRAAVEALHDSTDLVVQLSTGGAVTDPEEARLAVVDAQPDAASLTCGTVNFGDDVFLNRPAFIAALYTRMQERGVVPEFECFEPGHLATVERLIAKYGPPAGGHVHVDLVLGVPGAMPGTPAQLAACVAALPDGATFSATGVGRSTIPVMLAALAHGGHLRVGMEDTLTFAAGQPVRDNAQLVERAATLASLAQRPPLSPTEARVLLGIGTGRDRP